MLGSNSGEGVECRTVIDTGASDSYVSSKIMSLINKQNRWNRN